MRGLAASNGCGREVSSHFLCVPRRGSHGGVFGNVCRGSRGCGLSRWINLNGSSACIRGFNDWGGVSLDWLFGRIDIAAWDGALDELHGCHGRWRSQHWIGICCDRNWTGCGCRVVVILVVKCLPQFLIAEIVRYISH